jgi:mitotic spindle assembly checkpoint protein MAD1
MIQQRLVIYPLCLVFDKIVDYLKRKVDAENRSLRTSNASLQQELADLHDSHSVLARSTSQTITSQKTQITALSHQNLLLQEERDQFKHLADERNLTIQELQTRYDELVANQEQVLQREAEDESMSVVREELHRQAAYLRSLESINTKLTAELSILRERHRSVEVLREENHGLMQKIAMLDELQTKVIRLEAELQAARQEREEWYVSNN